MAQAVEFLKREGSPTAVDHAVMPRRLTVARVAAVTTLGQEADKAFSNEQQTGALQTTAE